MKKSDFLIIAVLTVLFTGVHTASAQDIVVPDGYELVDSLVYRPVSGVDSLLNGKDVFHIMPLKARGGKADVEIYQSQDVANSLRKHVQNNSKRTINGYRVRIFFDNKQTARVESEEMLKKFESMYHDVKAYRTYALVHCSSIWRVRSCLVLLLSASKNKLSSLAISASGSSSKCSFTRVNSAFSDFGQLQNSSN